MTDEMLRQAAWNASRMFVEALEEDYDPRAAYPPSPAFRRKLRSLRRRAEHPYAHAALQRAAGLDGTGRLCRRSGELGALYRAGWHD